MVSVVSANFYHWLFSNSAERDEVLRVHLFLFLQYFDRNSPALFFYSLSAASVTYGVTITYAVIYGVNVCYVVCPKQLSLDFH